MQHPRDTQACMEGKRMFCSSLYIPNKNIPKMDIPQPRGIHVGE